MPLHNHLTTITTHDLKAFIGGEFCSRNIWRRFYRNQPFLGIHWENVSRRIILLIKAVALEKVIVVVYFSHTMDERACLMHLIFFSSNRSPSPEYLVHAVPFIAFPPNIDTANAQSGNYYTTSHSACRFPAASTNRSKSHHSICTRANSVLRLISQHGPCLKNPIFPWSGARVKYLRRP